MMEGNGFGQRSIQMETTSTASASPSGSVDSEAGSGSVLSNPSILEDQIRQSNNQIGTVVLYGVPIVSLTMESKERLCLAQISSTLLKDYSYNEIHNRRVALGITCAQCTPVQLELLRRAGAMPVTSRRCGMITRREAERLCKSFLGDHSPPKLPENFAFDVSHCCAWGCRGAFLPSRYNSSRAKCIKCFYCSLFFSPNKFIFHSHRSLPDAKYVQPDAANFNSWRRHIHLTGSPPDQVMFAWEDVKAMFNGGSRKRVVSGGPSTSSNNNAPKSSSADPVQPSGSGSPPVKKAKKTVSKVSSSSASIRLSNSVEVAPQSPALSTASSIQQPITSNNLLARLSSIASNPAATALLEGKSPLLPADYWNHRNLCWPSGTAAPYPAAAAALAPFHPYSYYNYLISKSDQLMQQMAHPAGWQRSLPLIPPVIQQQNEEEDDADEIDVESTI